MSNSSDLKNLINDVVNKKNHIKEKNLANSRKKMELTNKDIERDEQVAMILDKNLLTYHFQPIVSARDGSIYAYEALMRVFAPVRLSPPELLESAERLERLYDVGVSGIHRLLDKVDLLQQANCVVTAAGMEGALASVIGGLVRNPVIAVPTSVGYGASFHGLSALLTMINSCANCVSVVNIDNGYGAGIIATQINRLACK